MPVELEATLLCEQYHCSPGALGYDEKNPKVMRNLRIASQVYQAATDRQRAKKKLVWDKENPGGAKLLKWARLGSSEKTEPGEVRVQLPERPR